MTDILFPQKYTECSINRKTDPRMPWHDIAVKLMGGSVQDLARHFIQYWNYVNLQEDMDDR
jgi:phospholipase D1/2